MRELIKQFTKVIPIIALGFILAFASVGAQMTKVKASGMSVKTGMYYGNAETRTIDGLSFNPDMVIIRGVSLFTSVSSMVTLFKTSATKLMFKNIHYRYL